MVKAGPIWTSFSDGVGAEGGTLEFLLVMGPMDSGGVCSMCLGLIWYMICVHMCVYIYIYCFARCSMST